MAEKNQIHAGSITGSVVVAASGNTINAKLRVELGGKAPQVTDPVDIHAEFAELRKESFSRDADPSLIESRAQEAASQCVGVWLGRPA
jgi:hypothetical protein